MKPQTTIKRHNELLARLRRSCESNFAGTWQEQIRANTGPHFGPNALEIYEKNCQRKINAKLRWIRSCERKLIAYKVKLGLPEHPIYINIPEQ